MNFFAHQQLARKNTKYLIGLFFLSLLVILVLINGLALMFLGESVRNAPLFSQAYLAQNGYIIVWTSLVIIAFVGLGSLFRMMQLQSGGSIIAEQLGGLRIEADTTHPLHRRLYNIVEEMAIASGVPVPDVFVLEKEPGINAFAAGYHTHDAAIAVTQGALETLSRDELQGVVAHEFGHIFSGDMRINIRLMGVLFGLLLLALIGRLFFQAGRALGGGGNRREGGNAAAAFILVGLGLLIIGYIGVFFGNWIKSLVSRQREYLADATAVQLTRNPHGVAGALKKIGASASLMETTSDEISHMLFSNGFNSKLFATHPPLEERIRAIDPNFDPAEFNSARQQIEATRQRNQQLNPQAANATESTARQQPAGLLDFTRLADSIGNPSLEQIIAAAYLIQSIPDPLRQAAHSKQQVREVVAYLLLSDDADTRAAQLRVFEQELGPVSAEILADLAQQYPVIQPETRLPILEIALNTLRHLPQQDRRDLEETLSRLIEVDGKVSVHEYALAKMLALAFKDTANPSQTRLHGSHGIADFEKEISQLINILAFYGNPDDLEYSTQAYQQGLQQLNITQADPPIRHWESRWHHQLNSALEVVNELTPLAKEKLLEALYHTVTYQQRVTQSEIELLRVIASAMHVPIPLQLLSTD